MEKINLYEKSDYDIKCYLGNIIRICGISLDNIKNIVFCDKSHSVEFNAGLIESSKDNSNIKLEISNDRAIRRYNLDLENGDISACSYIRCDTQNDEVQSFYICFTRKMSNNSEWSYGIRKVGTRLEHRISIVDLNDRERRIENIRYFEIATLDYDMISNEIFRFTKNPIGSLEEAKKRAVKLPLSIINCFGVSEDISSILANGATTVDYKFIFADGIKNGNNAMLSKTYNGNIDKDILCGNLNGFDIYFNGEYNNEKNNIEPSIYEIIIDKKISDNFNLQFEIRKDSEDAICIQARRFCTKELVDNNPALYMYYEQATNFNDILEMICRIAKDPYAEFLRITNKRLYLTNEQINTYVKK